MSKVIAIVAGRANGLSETLAKQALLGAKESGADDVEIINLFDCRIDSCIGCDVCKKRPGGATGNQAFHCFRRDDFNWIADKVMDADAIIYVMPMYEKYPPGIFKVFCDRFGPFFDQAFSIELQQKLDAGTIVADAPDKRIFKVRPVSFIAHGGSEWTTLGLGTMQIAGISLGSCVVDRLHYNWNVRVWNDDSIFARVRESGVNLVRNIGLAFEDMTYIGDPGHCPVCHNDLMLLGKKPDETTCAVCGMTGTLSIVDGQIKVEYDPGQYTYSHYTLSGKFLHGKDLEPDGRAIRPLNIENITRRKAANIWLKVSKPPKA